MVGYFAIGFIAQWMNIIIFYYTELPDRRIFNVALATE
jgi:hypothetical protein